MALLFGRDDLAWLSPAAPTGSYPTTYPDNRAAALPNCHAGHYWLPFASLISTTRRFAIFGRRLR